MSVIEQSSNPGDERMVILDKPLPKCNGVKTGRPKPAVIEPGFHYHRLRKFIHAVCVVVFFTLPLSSLMRFDIPKQRFYFFGYELWISEFSIVFFSMMFLMFVVAAMAMFYGRMYCGYLCPQMIFSEAFLALESKLQRTVNKYVRWDAKKRNVLSKSLFFLIAGLASVVLAFVFISYFVEPRDLLHRLLALDVQTTGGFAGAVTTLLILLDFLFLRLRFCTVVCPYGYLQGMLADGDTLMVHYRDQDRDCIECKKCERICHMGIDIRNSPYQIECVGCGECIDACNDVLARLGKQGLIHYVWGEHGEKLGTGDKTWYQKVGLRNAKRVVVLLIILCYGAGLFAALSMRRAVLVQISPMRTTLYRLDQDGTVYNRFRLNVANRGKQRQTVVLEIDGLPGTHFASFENAVAIDGGQSLEREFEIAAPPSASVAPGVNHFRLVSRVGNERDSVEETFITPFKDSR
jgi:cytochrome c oxidase accessory protein FixG